MFKTYAYVVQNYTVSYACVYNTNNMISSKAMSQVLMYHGQVTSSLWGYVKSTCFSIWKSRKLVMHTCTIVHNVVDIM